MFTHKAWTQLAFEIKCLLVGPAWEKLATAGNNKKNTKNDRWLTTPPVTTHFSILDPLVMICFMTEAARACAYTVVVHFMIP